MLGADPQADQQVEVGRRDAVGRRRADDLLQLLERVEAEGLHAMLEIGLGDRFLGLDRVHEAQAPPRGSVSRDQPHFADRGDVIMGDARVPQDLQQVGRRIGLHRIERPARKLLDEEAGGAPRGVRTKERDRLDRALLGDVGTVAGAGRGGQLAPARDDACATQGTSNWVVRRQSCLAVGSPMGQRRRDIWAGVPHVKIFRTPERFGAEPLSPTATVRRKDCESQQLKVKACRHVTRDDVVDGGASGSPGWSSERR